MEVLEVTQLKTSTTKTYQVINCVIYGRGLGLAGRFSDIFVKTVEWRSPFAVGQERSWGEIQDYRLVACHDVKVFRQRASRILGDGWGKSQGQRTVFCFCERRKRIWLNAVGKKPKETRDLGRLNERNSHQVKEGEKMWRRVNWEKTESGGLLHQERLSQGNARQGED